jgi:OOP family OmpA-OmpF porin
MMLRSFGITIICALALPSLALATPPEDDPADTPIPVGPVGDSPGVGTESPTPAGDVDVDVIADADAAAQDTTIEDGPVQAIGYRDRRDQKWIKRWAPEPTMGEIGIYGGVLLPSLNHELFSPDFDLPAQGFKQLNMVSPDVGLRLGFYPARFFGLEAEGGVMPSSQRNDDLPAALDMDNPALLYTARGHAVFQLGLWSVTPFVLVGGGALGVASERDVLGNDTDAAVHFGGGLKFFLTRGVMLRVDVRDVVSYKRGPEQVWASHHPEVLLGLSGTFGREKVKSVRVPEVAAPLVSTAPSDSDQDGVTDNMDLCVDAAEIVNGYRDEDGCPESDRDGDKLWDEQDACPDEAENLNTYRDDDGCPETDRDDDGFFDDQDTCPDEAETRNGYSDDDGCADEVPQEVQAFTGAIKGITFDNNEDTIRKSSLPTLDSAVQVLTDHPDVRINISGHTDDVGDREHNVDLSRRRAESVKRYLVEHGIDENRIVTEGLGPDKPADTNDTKAGRANNRRIEFDIITTRDK